MKNGASFAYILITFISCNLFAEHGSKQKKFNIDQIPARKYKGSGLAVVKQAGIATAAGYIVGKSIEYGKPSIFTAREITFHAQVAQRGGATLGLAMLLNHVLRKNVISKKISLTQWVNNHQEVYYTAVGLAAYAAQEGIRRMIIARFS